jgi:ABC-type branched-subunit amino acid transport system substrate-binding protein
LSRVYASLPLTGPSAAAGRELLLGLELALARSGSDVELVRLDSFSPDRDEQALANAERAIQDASCLAYVGDFHSSQVLVTAPLLSAAGLLHVAPVATFTGLTGQTLVRLWPHDGIGAAAVADWLAAEGLTPVLVVHDYGDEYGEPVGAMIAGEAARRELSVRLEPVWDEEPGRKDLGDARAVVYAGVAGPQTASLFNLLHALDPELWLVGTDGVAVPGVARALDPTAAARMRFFVPQSAPIALSGIEAMELVLAAVAEGGDRAAVVEAARDGRPRESILGPYAIGPDGLTTRTEYGRLAVVDRQLVRDLG